ncbi:MAG: isochorismatase family protein [Hyphomicrobiaceae bacterium]
MHRYEIKPDVRERVIARQGKLFSHDTIEAGRTALVVVDMQNYFCAEGFPAEVPPSRGVVPNINRIASAMRSAGGTVVWIQTSSAGACERWSNFQNRMLIPARHEKRMEQLDEGSEGFKLYPALDVKPGDIRVKKLTYSAFLPAPSELDAALKARGVDTILIVGTATNVCCESTARDAMLSNYRVVMVSDGNATWTDEEHAKTLDTFFMFFGDVMSTDEVLARLTATQQRKSA